MALTAVHEYESKLNSILYVIVPVMFGDLGIVRDLGGPQL
jgi:hypothetical protein